MKRFACHISSNRKNKTCKHGILSGLCSRCITAWWAAGDGAWAMTLGALRVCANLDWPLTCGLPVLSINNLQNISFGKVHVALTLKARSAFMISFLLGLDILLASNIWVPWVPCIFKNALRGILFGKVDSLASMRRFDDATTPQRDDATTTRVKTQGWFRFSPKHIIQNYVLTIVPEVSKHIYSLVLEFFPFAIFPVSAFAYQNFKPWYSCFTHKLWTLDSCNLTLACRAYFCGVRKKRTCARCDQKFRRNRDAATLTVCRTSDACKGNALENSLR